MKIEVHPIIVLAIVLILLFGDNARPAAVPEHAMTPPPRPNGRRRAEERIKMLNIDFASRVRAHMEGVRHD